MSSDLVCLMLVGREFHRRGPATWNALSAVRVPVLGMEKVYCHVTLACEMIWDCSDSPELMNWLISIWWPRSWIQCTYESVANEDDVTMEHQMYCVQPKISVLRLYFVDAEDELNRSQWVQVVRRRRSQFWKIEEPEQPICKCPDQWCIGSWKGYVDESSHTSQLMKLPWHVQNEIEYDFEIQCHFRVPWTICFKMHISFFRKVLIILR